MYQVYFVTDSLRVNMTSAFHACMDAVDKVEANRQWDNLHLEFMEKYGLDSMYEVSIAGSNATRTKLSRDDKGLFWFGVDLGWWSMLPTAEKSAWIKFNLKNQWIPLPPTGENEE